MSYTREYNNLQERQTIISECEALGDTMLHDDFDPDWQPSDEPHGTLTFDLPAPKTDEQLVEEAEEKALANADHLIDAITDLAGAKVFLKRLVARLIKKGLLP